VDKAKRLLDEIKMELTTKGVLEYKPLEQNIHMTCMYSKGI
jgi:hypothetical protein